MRRGPAALVALALVLAGTGAFAGTLRGTIVVERPAGPGHLVGSDRYAGGHGDALPEGEAQAAGREAAVVFVRGPVTPRSRDRAPATLDQRNKTFVPHLLVIRRGDAVRFPNSDPVYHNVFSYSRAKSFDLGRYPRGSSRTVTFDKPGIVEVFCDIHSNMNAFVLVLENDFYAVVDPSGGYVIENVPAGTWDVCAWAERKPVARKSVTVAPDGEVRADLTIP